jgi:hypothetical protein
LSAEWLKNLSRNEIIACPVSKPFTTKRTKLTKNVKKRDKNERFTAEARRKSKASYLDEPEKSRHSRLPGVISPDNPRIKKDSPNKSGQAPLSRDVYLRFAFPCASA